MKKGLFDINRGIRGKKNRSQKPWQFSFLEGQGAKGEEICCIKSKL